MANRFFVAKGMADMTNNYYHVGQAQILNAIVAYWSHSNISNKS